MELSEVKFTMDVNLTGRLNMMKALSKKFDRFMEHVLEEHIERRKGVKDYVAKVIVDVLLQLAEDPALEVKLERNDGKWKVEIVTCGEDDVQEAERKPKLQAMVAFVHSLFHSN
ncbi:flavonoid 3-hydroxylase [Sesbania bispinosa]|nr:flavonoid 3-hydroxylase [Sesbania bispinosa]